MRALAEFQAEFAAALLDVDTPLRQSLGAGLAVYQNTAIRGLIDALRANYPAVERLVGTEWFESVARLYVLEHLPTEPSLALYGVGFDAFLKPYSAEHDLDYLPFVAALDRLWIEAHFAADVEALHASELQAYSAEQLGALKLLLHPATRFAWLPHSAVAIWQHNHAESVAAAINTSLQVSGVAEGVLITRPDGVCSTRIDQRQWLFLTQLAQGFTLGEAATELLQQYETADVAGILSSLIAAGAFAALTETIIH